MGASGPLSRGAVAIRSLSRLDGPDREKGSRFPSRTGLAARVVGRETGRGPRPGGRPCAVVLSRASGTFAACLERLEPHMGLSQWEFGRTSRPRVFAHRGGATLAPENTLAAFASGLAVGADGLELDVRLSRDGIPVVHHDPELDRTTNAAGPVAARTAAELALVDAGFRFGPDRGYPFRGQGVGVPRLRDVLDRHPGIPLIVELKGLDLRLARAVVDDVRAAGASESVCLGSYSGSMVRAVRRHGPEIATSASREEVRWALYRSWLGLCAGRAGYLAFQVPECAGRTRIVSPRFIAAAHRTRKRVEIWTVDAAEDVRRLLDWGADGIISDRPDTAVATRDTWIGDMAPVR